MTENRISLKKQASCNLSLDIQFQPQEDITGSTIQAGTTIVVVSIQKGNINTTYRMVSATPTVDISSLPYPSSIKVEPKAGSINEIEVSSMDRIIEETE
jgi:hypothetical protein